MAIQAADFYLYANPESHYYMVILLSPRIFLLLNHTHLKISFFRSDTCDFWNMFLLWYIVGSLICILN